MTTPQAAAAAPGDPQIAVAAAGAPAWASPAWAVGASLFMFMADREAKVIYVLTVDTRRQAYKHS